MRGRLHLVDDLAGVTSEGTEEGTITVHDNETKLVVGLEKE